MSSRQIHVVAVCGLGAGERRVDLLTFTTSNTLADEDGLGPISYQWKRDGADIAVVASDPDTGQTLSYAITAGNTNSAFAIDSSGQITVANSAALDFETTASFALTVEVTDDGNLSER